jgi:site-specific recombinase XerD
MNEDSYAEYEKKAEDIRNKNNEYIEGFINYLQEQGLKEKTIEKHVFNVDFYINNFLLYYDALDVKYGCYKIDNFLGYWFIRKAMWSTPSSTKSNIASIKKFYRYLLENDIVDEDDYNDLCETINCSKEEWLDLVERYNDPTEENPFTMF